jgi:spermidine/putrescine transport system substrate-binding protein
MADDTRWTGRSLTRRELLRRSALAGLAVPSLSTILAACGGSATQAGGSSDTSGALALAAPDNPVTLPLYDDVPAVADGLKPEAGPLRIYNWNDYIYKKVLNKFQDEFGVEIEYTQFTEMSEAIGKIQNGVVDFDIFFPTIENLGKLVAAKLLQPINHSYLPNFQANIWPQLQSPFYDIDARYSAPYMTWKTGIGYRADQVPDPATLSNPLDIFWDQKYAGKIGVLDQYRETLGYAALREGLPDPFNSTDENVVNQAKQALLDLVPLKVDLQGSDYETLGNGSSWVRLSWSGNMNYTRYYLAKDTPVTALGYYYPPDGGWEVTNDIMVISSKAKNPVLAHAFMNFLMDVDNGLTNFGYEGYQPPFQNVDEDQFLKSGYIPKNLSNTLVSEDDFKTGQRVLAIPAAADQMWQDAWASFQAG